MAGLRVYISGPMTGRPNHNKPAFYAAAALLAEAGHIPVNPAEVCAQLGATEWTDCMRADKQDASGHRTEAMLDVYDHSRPVVKPSRDG